MEDFDNSVRYFQNNGTAKKALESIIRTVSDRKIGQLLSSAELRDVFRAQGAIHVLNEILRYAKTPEKS